MLHVGLDIHTKHISICVLNCTGCHRSLLGARHVVYAKTSRCFWREEAMAS
jgi:hypothetical protein